MKDIFIYICIAISLCLAHSVELRAQADMQDVSVDTVQWNYVLPYDIFQSLSAGNAVALSSHFNSSVEVSMPKCGSNVYSRKQAEVVMNDFFSLVRNPSFVVEHEQSMAAATMTIGSLSCDNAVYKTFILTQPHNGQVVIHQIRVERFDR